MNLLLRTTILSSLLSITSNAQRCGGPCLVPRGANPTPAGKYALMEGKEKNNWRYLFNWVWTEDGVQKHSLEDVLSKPPLCHFGYRRMFVSPAGNGLLVTGNSYASSRCLDDKEPLLFVFCDPTGKQLVELPLTHVLTEKEQQLGPCPNCEEGMGLLYVFAADPKLSTNGCFVEMTAHGTNRRIDFFLPIALPVYDREKFEATLAAAEWATIPPSEREPRKQEIRTLIERLSDKSPEFQAKASAALIAKGFLALDAVRLAQAESSPETLRSQAKEIENKLRPWSTAGWDAMASDLGLLESFLSYPDNDVVQATLARTDRILPMVKGEGAAARIVWIEKHRNALKWNCAKGEYALVNSDGGLPQRNPANIGEPD